MRKMTKTAVTLAAMSAMTVASASMAFAAVKEEANISAIDNTEAPVDSSASGTWGGDAIKGYTFTKSDGTKLKDQWAEIDGIWYYFDGDTIATNEFKELDDKGYFFDGSGRLATGWQKITSKMDAYSDIEVPEALYNQYANTYTTVDKTKEYDYHDFVWCYFDEHGVAKKNEWYQDWTGLWYYFDGNAMVKNVYDYPVNPDNYDAADSSANKLYGFDKEGAMLVGWNSKDVGKDWNNPTADAEGKVWYYYNSDGKMQGTGWKQIEGEWYLFADRDADRETKKNVGGYPMLANSYVASYPNTTAERPEYFYVNSKGVLVSGVQDVKDAWKIIFYTKDKKVQVAWQSNKIGEDLRNDEHIYVNFAQKNYAAKEGIAGNYYYTLDTRDEKNGNIEIVWARFDGNNKQVTNISNGRYDASSLFGSNYNVISDEWNFTEEGTADAKTLSLTSYTVAPSSAAKVVYYEDAELAEKYAEYEYLKTGAEPDVYFYKTGDTDGMEAISGAHKVYVDAISEYIDKQNAWVTAVSNAKGAKVPTSNQAVQDIITWSCSVTPGSRVDAISGARSAAVSADWSVLKYVDIIKQIKTQIKTEDRMNDTEAVSNRTFCSELKDELEDKMWSAVYGVSAASVISAEIEMNEAKEAMESAEKALKETLTYHNNVKYEYVYPDAGYIEATGYKFRVVGERVRNALIGRTDDGIYLVDSNGEIVKNKAVLIDENASFTDANLKDYTNAYLVFTADGTAAKNYTGTKKSITVGGITYWATDEEVTLGDAKATVFVSNKGK